MAGRKIKVLVVDDSALVRQTLVEILHNDREFEVIGSASNPYAAANFIAKEKPDVITLDIEMPKMDGLTFLKKLMNQHPIPVVIISSLTENGSDTALKALELGAVEIITKPRVGTKAFLEETRIIICNTVKAASQAKINRKVSYKTVVEPKYSADIILRKSSAILTETTNQLIVMGASTGGTEALKYILSALPPDMPGILVVQHMPEEFTRSFAAGLDRICQLQVKEAANMDGVINGRVLIAPGNRHMMLKRSGARYYVSLSDGPLVNRHRPSVDVLFRSVATNAGKNALGIIMTGMGDDGAAGLLEMKESGALTIAQDENSCVVFGMPREAIKRNAVDKIQNLDQIIQTLIKNRCK